MALSSSDFPPTKLEPWSHLSNNAGSRSAKKRLSAQMKELVSMDSRVSIETLSSENGNRNGNAKTRKETGERTPLWREFIYIKQP